MLGHDFPRLPIIDPEGSRLFVEELWEEIYRDVESYQKPSQDLWLVTDEEQISLYEIARGYHSKPETAGYVLEFGSWCCGTSILLTKAMIQREDDDYLIFGVTSSSKWRVDHATTSGGDWILLEIGDSDEIDANDPALNRLEVLFFEDVAVVYVNGLLLGTADAGSVVTSADVAVAYWIGRDDDISTARYEDFTVWGPN